MKIQPLSSVGFKWASQVVEIVNNSGRDLSTRRLALDFLRANKIQVFNTTRAITIEQDSVLIEDRSGTLKEIKI